MGTEQGSTTGNGAGSSGHGGSPARGRKRPRAYVCAYCETRQRGRDTYLLPGGGRACTDSAGCARRARGVEVLFHCARCSVLEFYRLNGPPERLLHGLGLCALCVAEVRSHLWLGSGGARTNGVLRTFARAWEHGASPRFLSFDTWAVRVLLAYVAKDPLASRAEVDAVLRTAELYGLAMRRGLR